MARFRKAIGIVLEHEGGFVDDALDPGGATNWGVSLRFLRTLGDDDGDGWLDGDLDRDGDVNAQDVRGMSRDQAIEIYRVQWWDRYRYSRIRSQAVATKLFDLAVNMGAGQAGKLLQRALRATGHPVSVDGQVGPKTRAAVARVTQDGEELWTPARSDPVPALVAAFRSEAAGFYRGLVIAKPVRRRWETGWLRRAYF